MSVNFNDDLKEGKKSEREFASRLIKWGAIKIEISEWDVPEYDVKATFHRLGQIYEKTYEVKTDKYAPNTDKVCIEYMYKWQPSWVFSSTADYIVYSIGEQFYYADRKKFLIDLCKLQKSEVVWGDDNNSSLWLVNRSDFNSITNEL